MSASRDKAILIGTGIFVAGFAAGVASFLWLIRRDVSPVKKPEAVQPVVEPGTGEAE